MGNRGTFWLALFLDAAVLAGCPSRIEPLPAAPESSPGGLADSIDPGPVEPLLSNLPPWLEALLANRPAPKDPPVLADLPERLASWLRSGPELAGGLESLLDMLALLRLTERRLHAKDADLADLSLATRIYHALDVPMLSDPQGFFAQLWRLMAQAAGQTGDEGLEASEMIEMVKNIFSRSGALHRRTAARILRKAPDSAEASLVLEQLAQGARRREDFEMARRLLLARLSRLGAAANGEDFLDLAESCAQSLRLDCADPALRRAETLHMRSSPRWTEARAAVALAKELLAAGEPSSLEEYLARADRLNRLGRRNDAERLLGTVLQTHRNDARPWLALAKVSLGRLRVREAHTYVRQADRLEHRDGDYYAMALGTFWSVMMDEVLPILSAEKNGPPGSTRKRLSPYLDVVKDDLAGLARFAPGRAAALQESVRFIEKILEIPGNMPDAAQRKEFAKLGDEALARVMELRCRFPREADVYRLGLLLARYTTLEAEARQVAQERIPQEIRDRPGVLLLQARIRLALAIRAGEVGQIPAIRGLLGDIKRDEKNAWALDALSADLLAIEAGASGRENLWPRVIEMYRGALENAPADQTARVRSNLGVALYRKGKIDEARALWHAAGEGDKDTAIPVLLLAVTAPGPDRRKEALLNVEGQSRISAVNYQARLWQAVEERPPAVEREMRLAEAWNTLHESLWGARCVDGSMGVVLDESFNVSMGYSETEGLLTVFELKSDPWLILPAPI